MKSLFILRHAKSSWDNPGLSDFERPLNDRGRRVAPFMGELMSRNGYEPYIILSSPATRARETVQLVREAGNFECEIQFHELIYEASPQRLLKVISGIDDIHKSALLVGHNPGLESLISYLTQSMEPMPTAALAVIELKVESWDQVTSGSGVLRKLYRPREEMQ